MPVANLKWPYFGTFPDTYSKEAVFMASTSWALGVGAGGGVGVVTATTFKKESTEVSQ